MLARIAVWIDAHPNIGRLQGSWVSSWEAVSSDTSLYYPCRILTCCQLVLTCDDNKAKAWCHTLTVKVLHVEITYTEYGMVPLKRVVS